jgi:hypothetical protein
MLDKEVVVKIEFEPNFKHSSAYRVSCDDMPAKEFFEKIGQPVQQFIEGKYLSVHSNKKRSEERKHIYINCKSSRPRFSICDIRKNDFHSFVFNVTSVIVNLGFKINVVILSH